MGDLYRENVRTKSPVVSASHNKTSMVCGLGPDGHTVGYWAQTVTQLVMREGRLAAIACLYPLSWCLLIAALTQLATRIAAVARYGASAVELPLGRIRRLCGRAPFGKNKGLIQSTLEKLESEVKSEAREAYCDGHVAKLSSREVSLKTTLARGHRRFTGRAPFGKNTAPLR